MSTEVEEAFPSPCRIRDNDRVSVEVRGDVEGMFRDGSTSFFCLDAGRISSRSTGTPNDTRNNRRVLERIQSGGASGGGATSCDHKEAERGVENREKSFVGGGRSTRSSSSGG